MTAARRQPAANTDAVSVRRGRSSPSYTDVHDWVMYSGASPEAIALYAILRSHVNRQRDDDAVWTSTLTLSVLLKLSRGDKVKPYLDELENLGAISINRGGLHRKNEYVVHALPPDAYTGPTSGPDWYERNKPMLQTRRATEKADRDRRRTAKRAEKNATGPASEDTPVTPSGGEQENPPVTPSGGEQVTPSGGEPVTLPTGREPDEVEPDEVEPDEEPSPPTSVTHDARDAGAEAVVAVPSAEVEAGGGGSAPQEDPNPNAEPSDAELLSAAADAAVLIRGTHPRGPWNRSDVVDAMAAALAAKHPAHLVAQRIVDLAEDLGTGFPGRLLPSLVLGVSGAKTGTDKPAFVPAPAGRKPRCQKTSHERYDADGCPVCVTDEQERTAAPAKPRPEEATGLTGRELARAVAPKPKGTSAFAHRRSVVRGPKEPAVPIDDAEPPRAGELFGLIGGRRS